MLGDAGRYLLSRVDALTQTDKAKVDASPKVTTLNNVEAVMDNVTRFFVPVAGYASADLYTVSTGVSLRVLPMVVEENGTTQIKLDVTIQDGQLSSQTVSNLPVITSTNINTSAFISQGQALLIAGYRVDNRSSTVSGDTRPVEDSRGRGTVSHHGAHGQPYGAALSADTEDHRAMSTPAISNVARAAARDAETARIEAVLDSQPWGTVALGLAGSEHRVVVATERAQQMLGRPIAAGASLVEVFGALTERVARSGATTDESLWEALERGLEIPIGETWLWVKLAPVASGDDTPVLAPAPSTPPSR